VTRLGPDAVALQPRSKNRVNGNDKWDKVTKLLIKISCSPVVFWLVTEIGYNVYNKEYKGLGGVYKNNIRRLQSTDQGETFTTIVGTGFIYSNT
jgi:hypothetical protein